MSSKSVVQNQFASTETELVAIALGSNMGDRHGLLRQALRAIIDQGVLTNVRASSVYETIAVGERAGGQFLNAVITGSCALTPRQLLDACMGIEQSLGRNRAVEGQGGPRTIDLDVLFFGRREVREPDLILPHPRMFSRIFVLQPLADIAGDLVLPSQKESVHFLLAWLDRTAMGSCVGTLEC
ncbi:MAG: 2-amino-4-hydroxy-6-hydroxymethyldihydropteridine diphosphokinase [Phycisphaerales bacterium]|nr:2-amino-4-hydroxy-6-hydroxymethyldihydropteridine diphosphokinase [Phycisphaerales bacterium]